ncbi:hypothetical protein E3O42_09820 [Cryobacterium adonitolivorans]|uniref:Uncharacterized protein n=1 Tax=Cryobacterium adonitolivorans TaxID=1259189 RepID=A0A4R8W8Q3_9MICO|nr:hypothetical protein [Cryobacterium adonitolivorans]TFC01660.1 hypothetical protein E3O42_09820 [Cryobacterium adonitolivorans]
MCSRRAGSGGRHRRASATEAVAALIVRATTAGAVLVHRGATELGYRWAFAVLAVLLVLPAVEAWRMPDHAGTEVAARRPQLVAR